MPSSPDVFAPPSNKLLLLSNFCFNGFLKQRPIHYRLGIFNNAISLGLLLLDKMRFEWDGRPHPVLRKTANLQHRFSNLRKIIDNRIINSNQSSAQAGEWLRIVRPALPL